MGVCCRELFHPGRDRRRDAGIFGGQIVATRYLNYRQGDRYGDVGMQEYVTSYGSTITRKVKEMELPLSLSLGVLGLKASRLISACST